MQHRQMPSMRILGLATILLAVASLSWGQVAQQLRGRVADPQGAVIPQAHIVITNEATAVTYPVSSSSTGDWLVPYLPPGSYKVEIDKTGFKSQTIKGVVLNVGQIRAVDVTLEVGTVSSSVVVEASSLAISTETADVSGTIPAQLVTEAPQNYRNVMATAISVAGSVSKNGLYTQLPYGNITSGITFNMSAGSLNLDGANNMSTGFQTMAYIPLVDTVQEMVVNMTPYDAGAVGFATGGSIDVHLKSGTNKMHGTVYDYYRSTGLDANTYQNNYYGRSKPKHQSQQFGFEADGPVIIPHLYNGKDKTFFTIGFEAFNLTQPNSTSVFSVPGVLGQASWLTPNGGYYQFSGLTRPDGTAITLYDPATLGYGGNANARESFYQEGAPNTYSIPVSRVNATALAILKYFPAPNITSSGSEPWLNNYFSATSIPSHYRNWMIKIDHSISQNDRVTLRWGRWDQYQTQDTNGFPMNNPARYGQFPYGQAFQDVYTEWVHTFNSHMVFDFKASINMDQNHTQAAGAFKQSTLGLTDVSAGVTQPSLLNFFPQINLATTNASTSGFVQMGSTGSSYAVHNQLSILPSLSYTRGAHDIHIGLDNREYQISTKQGSGGLALASNQTWTQQYNNVTNTDPLSGSPIASLMLDSGYLSGGSLVQPSQEFRSNHYWAVFFQDNWRVNRRLVLNLGVRYDFPNQAVDRHNRYLNSFDPSVTSPISAAATANGYSNGLIKGGMTFSGVNGAPRTQVPRAWYMLEPRFGFSYAINNKTVARGGFGMSYNWAAYAGSQSYGFSATTSISPSASTTLNTTPLSTLANPFPSGYVSAPGASLGYLAGLGSSPSFYNHFLKFGQTWTYSLDIQRQLTGGDVLDVSYVGKQFVHGPTSMNINTPGAQWYAQCDVSHSGTASLCTTANTTNPFKGIAGFSGTTLYSAAKVQSGQLLIPYPQYTGMTENGMANYNGLWYNSLQITETHRFPNSLVASGSYTYSRTIDNDGIFDYTQGSIGSTSNPNYLFRNLGGNDLNHRITAIGTYKLPVGRGRQFFGNMNRITNTIVGGWQIGGLYLYESGRPWQPQCGAGQGASLSGSTSCYNFPLGTAPLKMARTNTTQGGSNVIRGVVPCVGDTNQTTGAVTLRSTSASYGCTTPYMVTKAQYAPAQNLEFSGIRLGANSEFDANLQKNFQIVNEYKLTLKMDAFNVTNHAVWSNSYRTSNDQYFGTIVKGVDAQQNNPRYVQLSATVRW